MDLGESDGENDRALFLIFQASPKGSIVDVITHGICDGLYTKAMVILHIGLSMLYAKEG